MNFYNFMHKQIAVLMLLMASTGLGYVYIGWLYDIFLPSVLWYSLLLALTFWGYRLYKSYKDDNLDINEKELWLHKLQYFLFSYFFLWTIIFIIYTLNDKIELHYVSIATQFGSSVVATTILVSQRKLLFATLISLILPIFIYFIAVGEFYSYLLALFTVVVSGVLLYASNNTYNYLVKSQFQAYHDYLTKIGNRRYFIELLENSIQVQKKNNKYTYLLLVDLDYFKTINDTLGHDIGDLLLYEVSDRMKKLSVEHNCTVSRIGGDEFCLLSAFYETKDECFNSSVNFAEQLLKAIKENYHIEDNDLHISASIGVSIIHNTNVQASFFMKEADIAMYEAKSQGRDGIIIFNDALSQKMERKLGVELLLHTALENGEISLKYQPQLSHECKIVGCEVLVRWNNAKLGHIGPNEFITIAEQTGVIVQLGHFILEESFKTLVDWDKRGIILEGISINISMRQIFHPDFIADITKLFDLYLPESLRCKIIFEITETSMAEDIKTLIEKMNILRKLGIRFSMDDFGTGYSSLSYLQKLPMDELKIDKSFISELTTNDEHGKRMIKTILDIAHNLNLSVVAEGVETLQQKEFLLEQGCDILQGYYFSMPVDKESFELYYTSKHPESL